MAQGKNKQGKGGKAKAKQANGKQPSGKQPNGKQPSAKKANGKPANGKKAKGKKPEAKPANGKKANGGADDDEQAKSLITKAPLMPILTGVGTFSEKKRLSRKNYEMELRRLQIELVKLQEWIRNTGKRVVVIFEGRDAAGKGGVIKRITQSLSPRICKVVALAAPTEREATQWYFQRYVAHLPAAGEMVLLDRSWYNRAGVERVMGFCSDDQLREFMRTCPEFERMLVRSGIQLIKYWFSVSDEEQEKRFQSRIDDPTKRWKLSEMDLASREHWIEYSKAKDEMFHYTDIKQAPWYVVGADNKKRARLNCIHHLLSLIPYEDLTPGEISLPKRAKGSGYVRPPMSDQTFVPEVY